VKYLQNSRLAAEVWVGCFALQKIDLIFQVNMVAWIGLGLAGSVHDRVQSLIRKSFAIHGDA